MVLIQVSMLKESGVYKLTSPSGKVYIGQSCNIRRRLSEHAYMAKKGTSKIYSSIKKYGIENHYVEILFISDVLEEKNRMEQFFINFYNSINDGLNLIDVIGMRKSFTGKKHTEAEVQRIKERMNGVTPEWAISKRRKGIFCALNNKSYISMTECAKDLNISQPLVSMMVNKKTPNKFKLEKI
jgi:group I intron endonuclease